MAENKDVLMMRAFRAFSQGCGNVDLSDEACAWFHDRYYDWITTRRPVGTTPEEVWGQHGGNFLAKFREIGERAVGAGSLSTESLTTTADAVERASDCDWCPVK
ncbi:MAG TPA: hypothetical protein VF789_32720 [Thermoanaerobaculia bacterium]